MNLPFKLPLSHELNSDPKSGHSYVMDADGLVITGYDGDEDVLLDRREMKAFVVAMNAFPRLVSACKSLLNVVSGLCDGSLEIDDGYEDEIADTHRLLDALRKEIE